jgi:hypothetical protein
MRSLPAPSGRSSRPLERTAHPAADRALLAIAPFSEAVNLHLLGVAVDDPRLGNAQLLVERQLLVRLVLRAVDLHHRGRRPFKVGIVVDGEAIRRQQDEVGDTEVLGPPAGRADVDLVIDFAIRPLAPEHLQVAFERALQGLLFDGRRRDEVKDALPHFVPLIGTGFLSPGQEVGRDP